MMSQVVEARKRLPPVQSQYRVLFEDPADPDAPAKVLVPDPNWMGAALAGGILPSIGPMTEEQAIEYLIQKDIPPRVWRDYRGNRTILKIVPVELISSDRSYRNAWRISQEITQQEKAA